MNMFNLPAICDNCGLNFPSGFAIGSGAQLMITNNTSGPCPNCGGMGHIPNGIYEIVNDVEAILKIDNGEQIFKLQRILNTPNKFETKKSIEKKIKEETPYSGIIEIIEYFATKTKNTTAALGVLSTIIFSIIGVYYSHQASEENENTIKNQREVIKEQRNIINDIKEDNKNIKIDEKRE